MTDVAEARRFYAALLATKAGGADPRIEQAFAEVPREDFLGPGPWPVIAGKGVVMTPSADPVYIYRNALVALDPDKGINNGEPLLHALWMAKVAPQPGETPAPATTARCCRCWSRRTARSPPSRSNRDWPRAPPATSPPMRM
jgi:protein-L-isoaspartate(D-aspartate) O-methyltransferase